MSRLRQAFTGISNSGHGISTCKISNKKLLFLTLLVPLVLVSATIGIIAGVNSRKNSVAGASGLHSNSAHATVKSACSSTLYPDLCFSAIADEPGLAEKVSTHKDVIELSLNVTIRAVQQNYFTVKNLQTRKRLTPREKIALHDCLEVIDVTIDELRVAIADLGNMTRHGDDLKTLVSAAMTNQETCLDGFSHNRVDRRVREGLRDGHAHVERMCSNALAMILNVTDTESSVSNRKLMEVKEDESGIRWPEWMSAADRRILQSTTVNANAVVAADGSGDYKTVSEAVAAAPEYSSTRYVIYIKAGTYRENVDVPKTKTNVMFVGDGRTTTIITGSKNVVDGSTTFNSATVGK